MNENIPGPLRPKSLGVTTYLQKDILWGADSADGRSLIFFARVRGDDGLWGDIVQASTLNKLAELTIRQAGAGPKARVPAPQFFGTKFFEDLHGTRYTFPAVPPTAKCYACAATNQTRWRYDEVTLARMCEKCRTRRKRNAAEMEEYESDDEEDEEKQRRARLFTAAMVSTGLSFRKVHELFVKAEMQMPVREKEFYRQQRELIAYLASCVFACWTYSCMQTLTS